MRYRNFCLLMALALISIRCDFFKKDVQDDEPYTAVDFDPEDEQINLTALDSILVEDDSLEFAESKNMMDSFYEEYLISMESLQGIQLYNLPSELDSLRGTTFFEDNKLANQDDLPEDISEELRVLAKVKVLQEFSESKRKLFELHESLFQNAILLTDRSKHQRNGQDGLAYIWGSKEHTALYKPYLYNDKPNICQERMYGLDCSGMIYQLFLNSGVDFGKGPRNFANAKFFSKPKNWTEPEHGQPGVKPLIDYFDCTDCFQIANIKRPKPKDIKSGDVIYFWKKRSKKVFHIGICLNYTNTNGQQEIKVFESRGNPQKDCEHNKKVGPKRSKAIIQRLKNIKNYGVIRITAS